MNDLAGAKTHEIRCFLWMAIIGAGEGITISGRLQEQPGNSLMKTDII